MADPKLCPNCGNPIARKFSDCLRCGDSPTVRVCPTCEATVELGRPTCPVCDRPVPNSDTFLRHRGGPLLAAAIVSFYCFGPLVAPVVAVVTFLDLKDMDRGRMDPNGRDLTTAASITAVISTALNWVAFALIALTLRW